jgi:hypothetical protein
MLPVSDWLYKSGTVSINLQCLTDPISLALEVFTSNTRLVLNRDRSAGQGYLELLSVVHLAVLLELYPAM